MKRTPSAPLRPLWTAALVAAGLAVVTVPAKAEYAAFARVAALYADPVDAGFDSAGGGLLQIGGSYDEGDLQLELGWVEFDLTEDAVFIGSSYDVKGSQRVVPFLVTPRWRAKLDGKDRLSVLLGGSIGTSYNRVSATVDDAETGDYLGGDSMTKWLFTWGADLSLEWHPKPNLDLVLGYKYIVATGAVWTYEGVSVDVPDAKANVVYAGFGWRW